MTILEIHELRHSYNGRAPVLRGLSVKIDQVEFVGIIGLSGSGKSPLLRCINRLVEAGSGEIKVPRTFLGGVRDGGSIDVLKLAAADLRHVRRQHPAEPL